MAMLYAFKFRLFLVIWYPAVQLRGKNSDNAEI